MDLRRLLDAWIAQGEETAANVRRERYAGSQEPAPYPGKLLQGLIIDPVITAGKMAGGEVPFYTSQDMTRTTSGGWFGGKPTTEFIPAGSFNPKYAEAAAQVAGSAPMGGIGRAMALGEVVDKSVLGVNAPKAPPLPGKKPQKTLAEQGFMQPGGVGTKPAPNVSSMSYDDWLAHHGIKDEANHFAAWAMNKPPVIPAPAPVGPLTDKQKVLNWLQAGNYKSGAGMTSFQQQLVSEPKLAEHFANEIVNNPDVWQQELDAALQMHAAAPASGAAKIPADAQNLINAHHAANGQVGYYTGDMNKDTMITIAGNHGWNVDKLKEHYEGNPIGHSDDITFTKHPSAAIHPEWKAGYDPKVPKVPAAAGTPEGEFNKIVNYFISKGNSPGAAEQLGQQVMGNLPHKPPLEAVWKQKGVNTDLVKEWGVALSAPTPPKGYQSPFQYAGNKFGAKPQPAAPLAAPPSQITLPPGITPYEHLPMSKDHVEWRDLMHYVYQENLPVADLIGKVMDRKIPYAERLAASAELMRKVPPDWQLKLKRRQSGPQFIDMLHEGSDWENKIPTTFQGMPVNSRSNSLAEKRANAISGGFNPDEMFYKTTRYPQHRFFDPATKPRSQWSFLGKKPENVSSYGNYFYPLHLSLGPNVLEKDFAGEGIGHNFDQWLRAGTADPTTTAMIARNIDDVGGVQDQWMVRKPQQHRSTYAEFDPTKFNSPNLMDVHTVGINPFAVQQEEEQNPFPWLPKKPLRQQNAI